MNASETLKLLAKQWCSTEDLIKIGQVGRNTPLKIKKEIQDNLKKQGYKIPSKYFVPTKEVITFFNLDIDYLVSMSKYEEV